MEFVDKNNINVILKNIENSKYNTNFSYDKKNTKKIVYKIHVFENDKITINNEYEYICEEGEKTFKIIKDNDIFEIFINDNLLTTIKELFDIKYEKNKKDHLSIIIPISFSNLEYHSLINFDYVLKMFLNSSLNFNICIAHTENISDNFLDNIILENKINYIFIKTENDFSVGYNRNLWKYLCNSEFVMFNDIDIPISDKILEEMIDYSKTFDIIKPYKRRLFRLSENEKYEYICKNKRFFEKTNIPLYSISGGTIMIKKNVLEECGNFDEFYGYGFEDRNMDVILLFKNYKIKIIDSILYHLYHKNVNRNNKKITTFSTKYYKCKHNKNCTDNIHEYCDHIHTYLNYCIKIKKMYNSNIIQKKADQINFDNFCNIVEIENFSKNYYDNLFIKEFENNKVYLKQLTGIKYLTNENKLVKDKVYVSNNIDYNVLYTSIDLKYFLIKRFSLSKFKMEDYLKDKRVVIVGPADYVNNNELINSFDVIVRINKGYNMINTNKHGNRTDILYHIANQHEENGGKIPLDNNIKHIKFVYPVLDLYDDSSFKNIGTLRDYIKIYYDKKIYKQIKNKCSIIDEFTYLNFEKECESRPNSGLCAILDLLNYDIKELYITGFTLFQTNYDSSYRNVVEGSEETSKKALERMKQHNFHNQKKSAEIYKNNILKNDKVKHDEELINAVNNVLCE